jgi:hypothetical protein
MLPPKTHSDMTSYPALHFLRQLQDGVVQVIVVPTAAIC